MSFKILIVFLALMPFLAFTQEGTSDQIQTTAIIKKIENKRSGRTVKELATVSFTTENGDIIETIVELERIPFLGSFKSVGDEITVNYNKDNPAIAYTNVGNFLTKYGMYILIILGIFYSARTIIKARKKQY